MLRNLLDSPWLYFGAAGLLLLVGLASFLSQPPARAKLPAGDVDDLLALGQRDDLSLVFLLVDTLRADRLGSYGYARNTTPVLDGLARRGIRFSHVEAQSSWTKASMASLWTGAFPRRAGVLHYGDTLGQDAVLPAERFREAGFRTGGIYRNGWVDGYFGFHQGFELYIRPKPSRTPAHARRFDFAGAHPLQGSDIDLTDSALEFLRGHQNERFFLYLHYMDLHQYMYDQESAIFGTSRSDVYDAALRWTDRNVGRLLRGLARQGLLDRTVVVLASDHGEAFFEHGAEGHGQNLYREVTRTPLLIAPPLRFQPGIVVETPVRNVDVWPTLLDLFALPPLPPTDGRSLLPEIEAAARGHAPGPALPSVAELDRSWGKRKKNPLTIVAHVDGPWRYVHHAWAPATDELYDHRVDPGEQTNLVDERPEEATRLRAAVDRYLAEASSWQGEAVELDAMRREQLGALGYMLE